jgi:glutathione S-transferase
MRQINPLGRNPSLVLDGGEALIDSAAILDSRSGARARARRSGPAHGDDFFH